MQMLKFFILFVKHAYNIIFKENTIPISLLLFLVFISYLHGDFQVIYKYITLFNYMLDLCVIDSALSHTPKFGPFAVYLVTDMIVYLYKETYFL